MKIVLLVYGSLDAVSGGNIYDQKVVEWLKANGNHVEIVSIPKKAYLQNLADNFSTTLKRKLLNLDADVLIQDELCHPSLFLLNKMLSPKIGYPIVSIIHHFRSSEPWNRLVNPVYRSIEGLYIKSLQGYIFNCATTKNKAIDMVGQLKLPETIAFPAGNRFSPQISLERIKQKTFSSQPLRVVFLGNIIRRKGLHVLLDALSRVPKSLWELTIIGREDAEIDYVKSIYKQITILHLEERIRFLGKVADNDIQTVLDNSHVMCMPSLYEGYGIVYLEGMSFGLPSIASTAGGAAEIIRHKQNGFLVNPNSVGDLEDAITILAHDRECLFRMSIAALERYKQQPTWEETGRGISTFLHKNFSPPFKK